MLDGCGVEPNSNNQVVIWLDNRIASLPLDTVHWNTTEPDCGITAVRLGIRPLPIPLTILVGLAQ